MPQYFSAKINIKVEYCKKKMENFTFMLIFCCVRVLNTMA